MIRTARNNDSVRINSLSDIQQLTAPPLFDDTESEPPRWTSAALRHRPATMQKEEWLRHGRGQSSSTVWDRTIGDLQDLRAILDAYRDTGDTVFSPLHLSSVRCSYYDLPVPRNIDLSKDYKFKVLHLNMRFVIPRVILIFFILFCFIFVDIFTCQCKEGPLRLTSASDTLRTHRHVHVVVLLILGRVSDTTSKNEPHA